MSITVSGGLLYGFRVERESFFKLVGEQHVCPQNGNHDIMHGDKVCPHCPTCGTKTLLVTIEEPTPAFAEYVAQHGDEGESAESFWIDWVDDSIPDDEVGVFDGAARQGSYGGEECFVFGVCLANIDQYAELSSTTPVTLKQLEVAKIKIGPMAQQLGLELQECKLYPYLYIS